MICEWLNPIHVLIGLAVSCVFAVLTQDHIITKHIAMQDAVLYKRINGDYFKDAINPIVGVVLFIKLPRLLWGRKDLTSCIKMIYYFYLMTVGLTLMQVVIYFGMVLTCYLMGM